MSTAPAPIAATFDVPPVSLEASDEFSNDGPERDLYCPTELLGTFSLLMAGHGRCVNASMMLGDREYAMWQLACARTMPNEPLRAVAARLFAYFDQGNGAFAARG